MFRLFEFLVVYDFVRDVRLGSRFDWGDMEIRKDF